MTKDSVIELLASSTAKSERFNALLPALSGSVMPAAFRNYNMTGYSSNNLKTLEYDIKQAYGIKEKDIRNFTSDKVKVVGLGNSADGSDTSDTIINPEESKIITFFQESPEDVKSSITLRDRFPFLNDPECPEKFHTLVGLNITAYNQVVEARKELFVKVVDTKEGEEGADPLTESLTEEEIFALAKKAVENFELNIEGQEELEYYQEHKEILGNHPIFADEMLVRKINSYKPEELSGKQRNIRGYISRDSKKIKKAKDPESAQKIITKIRAWEKELSLIEEKLGVAADKKYVSKIEDLSGETK